MPGDVSRLNGRKGGRPKGRKNDATLEREAVAEAFRQRILQNADKLFNAQLSISEGCSFLFQRVAGGKYTIVRDPEAICRYLDGERGEGVDLQWIHTERPNNFAIQDMLNRAMGKPKEQVEHTGKDGGPIEVVKFGGRYRP